MTTFKSDPKDPDAVLDYVLDWTSWLASGETITGTPAVTVESGITKDSQSNTGTIVTVWLSGGTAGQNYTVAVKVTTTDARTDERTILVPVRDR